MYPHLVPLYYTRKHRKYLNNNTYLAILFGECSLSLIMHTTSQSFFPLPSYIYVVYSKCFTSFDPSDDLLNSDCGQSASGYRSQLKYCNPLSLVWNYSLKERSIQSNVDSDIAYISSYFYRNTVTQLLSYLHSLLHVLLNNLDSFHRYLIASHILLGAGLPF